jgi:hypothetical protein
VLEAFLFEDFWVHVILKMAIVDRKTKTVQPNTGKEFGIIFKEKILQELVEEEVSLFLSQDFSKCSTMLVLMAWITSSVATC